MNKRDKAIFKESLEMLEKYQFFNDTKCSSLTFICRDCGTKQTRHWDKEKEMSTYDTTIHSVGCEYQNLLERLRNHDKVS